MYNPSIRTRDSLRMRLAVSPIPKCGISFNDPGSKALAEMMRERARQPNYVTTEVAEASFVFPASGRKAFYY